MSQDEAATLRALAAARHVMDRPIRDHGGRIANTAGDSVLAEFPSAVDAVQCAAGASDVCRRHIVSDRQIAHPLIVSNSVLVTRRLDGTLGGVSVTVAQALAAHQRHRLTQRRLTGPA